MSNALFVIDYVAYTFIKNDLDYSKDLDGFELCGVFDDYALLKADILEAKNYDNKITTESYLIYDVKRFKELRNTFDRREIFPKQLSDIFTLMAEIDGKVQPIKFILENIERKYFLLIAYLIDAYYVLTTVDPLKIKTELYKFGVNFSKDIVSDIISTYPERLV